jgi:type II secretory pathway component PulF
MNDKPAKRSVAVTAVLLFFALNGWIAIFLFLLLVVSYYVPRHANAMQDRGERLPTVTQWVLAASHWTEIYWYVVPLFGALVLPVIILFSWWLRHRARSAAPGWIWLALMLGLPWLVFLGLWIALLLP